MPELDQLMHQISELDTVQREELLFALSERTFPYITLRLYSQLPTPEFPSIVRTPHVCGGAARLIRTRIPIWTLERMRLLGMSEIDILQSYPTLRATDLVQAWAYANRYRNEVEQAIRENEEE